MNTAGVTLTVSELNEYVRVTLASDPILHGIRLRGEISNFKRHSSGHWYFTLKDEAASVNCAMFRQANLSVRFAPSDGQRVTLIGSAGLYAKTGQYQFYADAMQPEGIGELFQRFEALKAKLTAQGIFDPAIKKPLPLLPRAVGVVTSPTGAVIHDIQTVAWRRNPSMPIYLYPAQVQGVGAENELARGLRVLDGMENVDVIILARGGGSMEDLWPFNEELLARAIYECDTPVVSAVGHETDFTIADFASDVRAATPSAAAELCVCDRGALLQTIDSTVRRAERACDALLSRFGEATVGLIARLREQSPSRRLDKLDASRALLMASLHGAVNRDIALNEARIAQLSARLRGVGPDAVIGRGYALVMRGGKPVVSAEQARENDSLSILMRGGEVEATVTGVERRESTWQENR